LTDSLAGDESVIDRRVDAGAVGNVGEGLVDGLVEFGEKLERSVATLAAQFGGGLASRLGRSISQ